MSAVDYVLQVLLDARHELLQLVLRLRHARTQLPRLRSSVGTVAFTQ
jgi:hypothetical protein